MRSRFPQFGDYVRVDQIHAQSKTDAAAPAPPATGRDREIGAGEVGQQQVFQRRRIALQAAPLVDRNQNRGVDTAAS